MPTNRKRPCRECCTPTQTRSGVCIDCDPPTNQQRQYVVHRSTNQNGVVHAVYELFKDGSMRAYCRAGFICGKVDDVPARMLSCLACKRAARGFGKLASDGVTG